MFKPRRFVILAFAACSSPAPRASPPAAMAPREPLHTVTDDVTLEFRDDAPLYLTDVKQQMAGAQFSEPTPVKRGAASQRMTATIGEMSQDLFFGGRDHRLLWFEVV